MKEKFPCLARQKVWIATVPHLSCFGNWVGGCLEQCAEQLLSALPGEIVFCLLDFPLALVLNLPLPASPSLASSVFLSALVSFLHLTHPLVKARCLWTSQSLSPMHSSDPQSCAGLGCLIQLLWESLWAWVTGISCYSLDLNFPSKLLQSAPLRLKSSFGIHSVVLKVNCSERKCPRFHQEVCCQVTLMYILLLLQAFLMVRQSHLSHPLLLSTWGNLGHSVNRQSFLCKSFSCWVSAAHRAFSSSACPGKAKQCGEGIQSPTLRPEVAWCVGGTDVREGKSVSASAQF